MLSFAALGPPAWGAGAAVVMLKSDILLSDLKFVLKSTKLSPADMEIFLRVSLQKLTCLDSQGDGAPNPCRYAFACAVL